VRICLVTHNIFRGDGQGRVNYELVRHCLAHGISVTVVAHRVAPEVVEAGAEWVRVQPGSPRGLVHVYRFARRAARVIRDLEHRCDVVVANGVVTAGPHDINICHFVHRAWMASPVHVARMRSGPYAWYQALYTRCNSVWERRVFDHSQTVVAVSEKVRQELVGAGVPNEKIKVILNGVDLDEFRPGPEPRIECGLPADARLALFVGDIRTPRKNLDSVLRAMIRVRDVHLAVVGEVRNSPFPVMVEQFGLSGRVHFLGFRRDVARIMRACDLLVFPSRYEACSLVLLEALASGLPVVTAVTAGGSELVDAGCGEVLTDPDDITALALAMERWLSPLVRGVAATAARAAAERNSWSRMAERYLHLFEHHARHRKSVSLMSDLVA
jgi:glycosyltransferase involved in cell wall biosynthesis